MNRYIDAYKIPYHDLSDGKGLCQVAFLEDVMKVPTADVRENVRGEWLYKKTTNDYHVTGQCSNCHERRRIDYFCPNCGADMRGEE